MLVTFPGRLWALAVPMSSAETIPTAGDLFDFFYGHLILTCFPRRLASVVDGIGVLAFAFARKVARFVSSAKFLALLRLLGLDEAAFLRQDRVEDLCCLVLVQDLRLLVLSANRLIASMA